MRMISRLAGCFALLVAGAAAAGTFVDSLPADGVRAAAPGLLIVAQSSTPKTPRKTAPKRPPPADTNGFPFPFPKGST
jgi:hypothetical protein